MIYLEVEGLQARGRDSDSIASESYDGVFSRLGHLRSGVWLRPACTLACYTSTTG